MKRKKMISILLILIMILQGSMPAMAATAGMGSETEHETAEALATETMETVTETPETEETPAQSNEETQEQEGDVQPVPKASISLFSDFSSDLFVDGPTETIKKTFKKPANGISKAVIQLESKKEGYVKGEDLSVNFGIELMLDDGWLYTNLLVHEGDAGYPQFSGNPEDYDLYNAAVDEYLQGLTEDELPTIEYIYDLGPSFALPEGEEKNSRDLMSGDEKVGTILTEKRDSDYHCIVTVSFDKKVYNRESVAAGARIGLQIDENALKDGEPVFAGWLDGQLVVETSGKLKPDDPADVDRPEYTVEKTGPEKVDAPYVDYTIHVETKKDGLDLSGMVLVDDIPLEMKLVSAFASGNELSESSDGSFGEDVYVIGSDGKFLYQFPDAAAGESPLLQADLTLRLALKDDIYKAGINSNGGIQATLSNEASLWNKERTEEKARSQAVETGMDLCLVSKDGRQEGMNGLRYSWTLDINTQFSHMAEAYLVDRICLDDHEFDAASGLQVYRDGRFLETLSFAEKTLENPISYEDLTKENIRSIAGDNSFYYTYTGADGKNYAVLIIPFKDGYQNHKIKIKYFTDLNRGGLSVEEWLDKNNDQPKNLANDVKFLWKWFRYGDGPEWTDFTWDIDLRKEVNTSVTLGRKNAGIYNESTQMMRWKFTVNEYGALLENTNITDILGPQVYDLSTLKLTYKKYNRDDKRVESGNLTSYTIDPGSGELVIQLGEVLADTYYEIFLDVKVIAGEFLASQGSTVGTLKNTAVFSAVVNGQEKVNSLDAEKILKNTLISKTVEGGYDYRTKEIPWKVTMDMNHLPVEGAQITDTLPDGSSFGQLVKVTRLNTDGSIETGVISGDRISFDNLDITMTAVPGKTGDGKYTKDTVTFSFHDKSGNVPVNDSCYVFEYTTVISDEQYLKDVFKAEEDVEVKNHVALSGKIQGKEIDATANSEAVVFVKSGSIVKEGTYVPADGLIHWKISFNQDRVDLSGMVLVEEIGDQPLEILEDTVKLYEIHPDGTRTLLGGTKQGDAALPGLSVLTIKTLNYTIPADQGNMELCMEFDTALTESALKEDISNDAKLMNGDEVYQEVNGADGGYDGQFDIDDYVKSAKKPVFQLIKTSSNDDEDTAKLPLAGAEFKLEAFEPDGSGYKAVPAYDKKGSTGKDGKITFVNLRKNFVYKLSEKSAPVGYEFNTDDARYYIFEDNAVPGDIKKLNVDGGEQDVICMNAEAGTPAEGLDGKLVFHNTPKADIKFSFTKENPDGTKGGAKFRLQDTQGCLKARVTSANADGRVSFEKVDPGNYFLTELTSQDPFDQGAVFNVSVKPDGSFSITKKSGNGSVEGTNSTTGYIIKNEYVKGTILLKKQDFEEGNIPLAGAVFTLYDAAGLNPVLISGKEVTAVSGSDGIATFSQIPYSSGGYKIIETVPPKGYEITDTISMDVTGTQILGAIQAQTVEDGTAKSFTLDLSLPGKELKNVRTKGTITLTKTNDAKTSLKLANRTFVLCYNDSDGYNGWSKGEEVARETTDDGGTAVFNDVPYGNYKISEVHGEKDIYKTFDKDFNLRGQIKTELENHRKDSDSANDNTFEIGIEVVNTLIKGDFSIHKSNVSTGEKMQGVTFVLSGNDAYGDPVYMEKSTDSQGKLTCSNVPVSETYYNLEEVQYEGFEQGDAYHVYVESVNTGSNGNINNNASIRIIKLDGAGNETGDSTEITGKSFDVTNIPIKGRIEFKKVDADTPGKGLAGAEFVLRRIVDGTVVTDPDSDLAPVTVKSNDEGDAVFENVEFGNYEIEEIKAPDGYMRNTEKISVSAQQILETVSEGGFHCTLQAPVTNRPVTLAIGKKDPYGEKVPGAQMKLTGIFASGNGGVSDITWTTSETDKDISRELICGNTYTLTETASPKSGYYQKISAITFKVGEDGILSEIRGADGEYVYRDGLLTVVDSYYLADVQLVKTDKYDASKSLANVTFDLYKQTGDEPDLRSEGKDLLILAGLKTDDQGAWKLSGALGKNPVTQGPLKDGLPPGKYYFMEKVPHEDYVLGGEPEVFEVKASDHGRTVEKIVKNAPVFTSIKLLKLDGTDGQGIGGTDFRLDGPEGAIGQFSTTDSSEDMVYTGEDGSQMSVSLKKGEVFISGLVQKGSYTLTEIKENDNYENASYFQCRFEITSESESGAVLEIHSGNEGSATPYNLTKTAGEWNEQGIVNRRKTGTVTLKKLGDLNGTPKPLAGAEFTLFYNSGEHKDTAVLKDGNKVFAVTDDQGCITIDGLGWDSYYLKETKAPEGFALDNAHLEFEIGYGNLSKGFSLLSGTGDVVNKATEVTFNKLDRSTKDSLAGAVFTVEGIFAGETKETTRTLDMTETGSLTVYGEWVGGNTYTLKEIKAPDGCILEIAPTIFTVGLEGEVIVGDKIQENKTISVENSPIEVSLKKMDGENKNVHLAGAVFTLVDDTLMGQGISVVTATEGIVLPRMIQGHKYTLEEVKAPDGYSMGGDTLKASFMVEEDGTVRIDHNTGFSGDGTDLLTCENRMVQLSIQKFSPDGRALKGCVFEVRGVFASSPQNRVFGRMGEETIIVDDEHPDALKGRLIVGNTYVLKEHTPPHGFEVGGEVKFTVNGDGTLTMEASQEYTLDEKTGAITMVNDPVEIGFFKTDMEGSLVEGSVFKVTGDFADGSTEQVIRLDGKEPVVLKELFKESEEGVQYILEEVSPPEGYEALKESVSFKVSSGGEAELTSPNDYVTISEKEDIYYFQIKNEKIKEENKLGSNGQSTLTGDNTPVWAGIIFMIASASVFLGTAFSRRRKRTMK